MYSIVLGSRFHQVDDRRVAMNIGMARDLLAQVKFEPQLRILSPTAPSLAEIKDAAIIDLDEVPNLSFAMLPYDGSGRSWIKNHQRVKEVLIREARLSDVWHTTISRRVWDLSRMSYEVGRKYAPGLRVFVMDSDPVSMLRGSGRISRLKSYFVQRQFIHRLQDADLSIFVGQGVHDTYAKYAKQSIMTNAVWLTNGEIADPAEVAHRFQDVHTPRLVLPTRLAPWKGVDDAIRAVGLVGDRLGPFRLDIVGEGGEKNDLVKLVKREGLEDRIQFLPSVAYGEPFFRFLRNYHMVLAPTRALEEVRIVYDAAANGCVLVHSATRTLENALQGLSPRWSHEPSNPRSLADALASAFAERDRWREAGLAGLEFMRGRTIDEMHRIRSEFMAEKRLAARDGVGEAGRS